ncbi:MAG: single-stranded DNA-binding protein [Deltaproteobacteria bacterium]|nr:single-stranded DNA-binding protein [Deltaproteobacteria bacterium]
MARSLNKVMIIGRLGKDPEVRYTTAGQTVATFSVATDESWTNKEGQREEKTEWHRIVAWGKLGEICGKYLTKGKLVYLEGKLQTRDWMDQNNVKRYTTEIVARDMVMLDSAGAGGRDASYEPPPPESEFQSPKGRSATPKPEEDDDIPF